jgi:hypothetical protein
MKRKLDLRPEHESKKFSCELVFDRFGRLSLEYINKNLDIHEKYELGSKLARVIDIRNFLNEIINEHKKEGQIQEDLEWDCVFKSQGITLSEIIKDAKQEGIEIGIQNGRQNLLAYLQTEIDNFLENNKTLEDFKDFLKEIIEHKKEENT